MLVLLLHLPWMDPANVAAMPYVVWAASADPMTWLVNFGGLGVVLVLVVTGFLRTKAEVAALTKIADERLAQIQQKDAAIEALIGQITHTLPQLAALAEVVEKVAQTTDPQVVQKLAALTAKIEKIERRQGGGPHGQADH